jgi:hypothetical protein
MLSTMTPEIATEIIRAVEAVERQPTRRAQVMEAPAIDPQPARDFLMTAWATRHGFTHVVDDGCPRVTKLADDGAAFRVPET